MLSILIPTHDYTCYKLVYDLHEQAERLGVPYEILLAEDGSKSQVNIIANHKITDLTNCRHIVRKENVGQARLRNELAAMAMYDWIIFIDSDAKVEKADFLQTYLDHVGKADVVVGGLYHAAVNYDPDRTLRFTYEKLADKSRSAATRQQQPYSQMTCFNVMMRRAMFLCIRFDESCHKYGYEDALFGIELQRHQISVLHIDNALLHTGIDTNEAFVRKSETALCTLIDLGDKMLWYSNIGKAYQRVDSLHLVSVVRIIYSVFGGMMRRRLCGRSASITLLQIYKLGYFAKLMAGSRHNTITSSH